MKKKKRREVKVGEKGQGKYRINQKVKYLKKLELREEKMRKIKKRKLF